MNILGAPSNSVDWNPAPCCSASELGAHELLLCIYRTSLIHPWHSKYFSAERKTRYYYYYFFIITIFFFFLGIVFFQRVFTAHCAASWGFKSYYTIPNSGKRDKIKRERNKTKKTFPDGDGEILQHNWILLADVIIVQLPLTWYL